jgi:hypothetical protein
VLHVVSIIIFIILRLWLTHHISFQFLNYPCPCLQKSTNEFTITMPDTTKYLILLQIQRLHSKLEACPRNSRCMIDAGLNKIFLKFDQIYKCAVQEWVGAHEFGLLETIYAAIPAGRLRIWCQEARWEWRKALQT